MKLILKSQEGMLDRSNICRLWTAWTAGICDKEGECRYQLVRQSVCHGRVTPPHARKESRGLGSHVSDLVSASLLHSHSFGPALLGVQETPSSTSSSRILPTFTPPIVSFLRQHYHGLTRHKSPNRPRLPNSRIVSGPG